MGVECPHTDITAGGPWKGQPAYVDALHAAHRYPTGDVYLSAGLYCKCMHKQWLPGTLSPSLDSLGTLMSELYLGEGHNFTPLRLALLHLYMYIYSRICNFLILILCPPSPFPLNHFVEHWRDQIVNRERHFLSSAISM